MRWMLESKCRHENPGKYDSDNAEPAELSCAGCPVKTECAQQALKPINVTAFIQHLTGVRLDEDDDWVPVSGVKMAGVRL